MDRPLRIVLRSALALLIMTGVALVVYSVAIEGPRRRANLRSVPPPPPVAPGPEAPGPSDATSSEQQPAPPEAAQAPPDVPDDQATASGQQGDVQPEFKDFRWTQNDVEVTGAAYRSDPLTKLTHVLAPVVLVPLTGPAPENGVTIQVGDARVTAEKADIDEATGTVNLQSEVLAQGEDFEVRTSMVVFRASDRSLSSASDVRIQKDRVKKDGSREPAMVLTGQGLQVDLTQRTMIINRHVQAWLYEVSQDFLAADGDELVRDVVISSAGLMRYEHVAREVVFTENVRAVAGPKTLQCDKLTIRLGQAQEGEGRLAVTNIVAEGTVSLSYGDQVARGDRLEWQEVTHNGSLTGETCVLETDQFRITGSKLSFYRMNSRFLCEGPGELLWKAAGPEAESPEAEKVGSSRTASPITISRTDPVNIRWTEWMSYDVAERSARCAGNVAASQKDNSLTCDSLDMAFSPDGGQVHRIQADGHVVLRDRWTQADQRVLCDMLIWDWAAGTVELKASEGQTVSVTRGRQAISSSHIVFDQQRNALECRAAGRLILSPTAVDPEQPKPAQTDVEWQETMRYEQEPVPLAVFTGDVRASRDGQVIRARKLDVTFDKEFQAQRMVAKGNATIEFGSRPSSPPPSTGSEPTVALPAALGTEGAGRRLSAEEITIDLTTQTLTSSTPGTLTSADGEATVGLIKWQGGMLLNQADNRAQFTKQVEAEIGGSTLNTEELHITFNRGTHLRHVSATGAVRFSVEQPDGGWRLKSSSAEAFFVGESVLTHFIARDAVEVREQDRILDAGILQLFLETVEGREQPVITRALAQKSVRLRYERENGLEAGGDQLEWTRETNLYVLTGTPTAYLRQGVMGHIKTDRIVLERGSGEMQR